MDPPAVASTPSLNLTRVSSAEESFGSPSSREGGMDHCDGSSGGSSSSDRELLYDQLRNMITQEERDGYKCCDYLRYYSLQSQPSERGGGSRPSNKSKAARNTIDEGCRTSICGWMYRVADHFSLDREVVSIALSYIDRILSTNYCSDRRTFKLISATSLHLAIKVHFPHMWREVGCLLPDLSRGDFGLEDLVEMEGELTHSLTWLMNPATPQSIIVQLLSLLPQGASRSSLNDVASTALFLAELSVCDYFFVTTRKSVVAIAAILNATESAGYVPFETHHHGISFDIPFQNDWHSQLERVLADVGYHTDRQEVSSARERLWSLYGQSSEAAEEEEDGRGEAGSRQSRQSRKANLDSSARTVLREYPSPTSCRHDFAY